MVSQQQKIAEERAKVNYNDLDWWIHFAVDNNMKSVQLNYAASGYTNVSLSPEALKDNLSILAQSHPKEVAGIINVPIVRATTNWTSDIAINDMNSASNSASTAGAASKVNWASIGAAVVGVGSILVGVFGGGVPGTGNTQTQTQTQSTDLILGLQKNVFYLTLGVTIIILALIFYLASKK